MTELTGKQRRFLRALAHDKKPVVQIGQAGLTDAVNEAIRQALETHELIKIKLGSEVEIDPAEIGTGIERACGAHLAQVIGRTLIVYKPRAKEPKINLPRDNAGRAFKGSA